MPHEIEECKTAIRNQVIALAREIGVDAAGLDDDDILPEKGYLDSAAVIKFILWCEMYFKITLDDDEVTLDSFGSVNAAARLILSKLKGR